MLWLDYYWHKVLKRPYTLSHRIDKGRGQPVVFLHGIAATGENWRQVSDMLNDKHYRVVVLDLLGFGDSPQPDWLEYSVDDHAKAVLASLQKMHVRKPVILVGHSMGGLVAAHIAQRYPRRVKQLILYQMPIYADAPRIKDFRRQAYLSVFRYLAEHPKITLWYARVLGRTASNLVGFVLDERTWQPFEMSLRNTIMQQRSLSNLRHLLMPTDVIYGKYDVFVMRKTLQHFFRPSRRVKFYEIDDIHRVSNRSSQLIFDLITQDPLHERVLSSKHARLVDMRKQLTVEILPESSSKNHSRRFYAAGIGVSLVVLVLSAFVALQGISAFEKETYFAINGGESPVLIETIARMSSDAVWLVAACVGMALFFKQTRKVAYRIAVLAVLTNALVFIIEHIVQRARPAELLPADTIQRAIQDGFGYPSSHTATIVIIALVVLPRMSPILRVGVIMLVLLVGWSRMYLGVHLPLDVIGGLVCAGIVYFSYQLISRRILRKVWL
jgi:pimeloyl-ACP methyl ester carboxylesterase/membrane-associated phospholipid phosphatase